MFSLQGLSTDTAARWQQGKSMFSQQASASARPPSTQIKFRGQDWVLPLPHHSKRGRGKYITVTPSKESLSGS